MRNRRSCAASERWCFVVELRRKSDNEGGIMLNWAKLELEKDVWRSRWASAGDIRYILIDDFLAPATGSNLADFRGIQGKRMGPVKRNHKHVYRKNGSPSSRIMTSMQRDFFAQVNSARFCDWMRHVTGADPIYADDELFGGGLHEILPGGYLNVHTDFNHHPKTLKHRRFNLLVYLNEVWDDAWNGHIELWDQALSRPFVKAAPIMGRALLFETSERSFHGHPLPLATPEGVTRKSLATYYYSEFPAGLSPRKNTNYQLTRQQWAQLMVKIADLVAGGQSEEEVVASLGLRFQKADLRVAYEALMKLRAAKYSDEPYWELPDGQLTVEVPDGQAVPREDGDGLGLEQAGKRP
jgi:Rps23 Pro-64 3,4-dihydroxylase Tpa1-like proline 4-hydroxylase